MKKNNIYFISGIDTGIGKSYAAGYLCKLWNEKGYKSITQKLVQTGNDDVSEDIELHRQIMGTGFLKADLEKWTMPEIYSYPCSPHLAAALDKRPLDLNKINHATEMLAQEFDRVLIEGAGGLMVPLTEELLTIEFIKQNEYPVILVTSGRLGSINHTLLSIEALINRGIKLDTLVYNMIDDQDQIISKDTYDYFEKLILTNYPDTQLIRLPTINLAVNK